MGFLHEEIFRLIVGKIELSKSDISVGCNGSLIGVKNIIIKTELILFSISTFVKYFPLRFPFKISEHGNRLCTENRLKSYIAITDGQNKKTSLEWNSSIFTYSLHNKSH